MPAASGCTTSRLRSWLSIFRIVSRRCLRFISRQCRRVRSSAAFLFFCCGLGFMLAFLHSNSTWPGPVGEPTQTPQRGRAALLFRTTPATIYIIANSGAMLDFGQKRTNGIAALVAEPGCDLILAVPVHPPYSDSAPAFELLKRVSRSHNHPNGAAAARF